MRSANVRMIRCVVLLCLLSAATAWAADGKTAAPAPAAPAAVAPAAPAAAPVPAVPPATPAASPAIDKPLIAHWTFDEDFGTDCRDSGPGARDASPEGGSLAGLRRVSGLFGNAMSFSGGHALAAGGKRDFGPLPKISFSVWTIVTDLSDFREIFRKEDGENRLLFSFQDGGKHLSLGLNVGGYIECDAPIDAAKVIDGRWHHCAATFDGQFMRVYLDGKEIGSLKRPGQIAAGTAAAGYIGSSQGGECFQGTMDDLRMYRDALTAGEIGQLYQAGLLAMDRLTQAEPADEPTVGTRLLAHWTFNERTGTALLHEASGNAALAVQAQAGVPRIRGVHGNALDLHGPHSLAVNAGPVLAQAADAITLCVWAKPREMARYCELFRQECPQRVLFSFQDDGAHLSMGLNVGGYEECDAPIDLPRVMDGQWHHCAATFDGKFMRVYLDGKEIGSLQRPGKIAVDPAAPCYIGSGGGKGEYFQGGLDDLRIYGQALPGDQIETLYRAGIDSLARHLQRREKDLAAFWTPEKTFAATLALSRKNLAEKKITLDRELADAFLAKLRAAFPADYDLFVKLTGGDALRYLMAKGNEFNLHYAGRMMELAAEYKPLTEHQWKSQTPEQRQKWEEVDALCQKFQALQAQGDSSQFSPDWVTIVLEAGPRIQLRPYINEPVAPYVTPHTPETRDLTAAEARQTLERDWLFQADNNPTPQRIRDEIRWTRRQAEKIRAASPRAVDYAKELAELDRLDQQAAKLAAADRDLYFQVRQVKRKIMFANPAVTFDKVLFVDMPYPAGSEWQHETRHREGYMAVPGGRLLILEGLSPEGKLTQLMPQAPLHGSFWRPEVSFDAKKVLFCFKPANEKAFHLYEINADGTGLTQLTDGPYDDFDPIYLPDGQHIVFSTTRGNTYVRCMPPTNAYVLARCERDGHDIYLISYNNEPDYLPSVMSDGRLLYTRWEYTDKPLWRAQKLWTGNPDGTQVSTLWGNQSVWPDLLKDARAIPHSRRVMFTGSAHHNWFSGSVGIIDPEVGNNFPYGLKKVTADVPWPECGNGPVDPVESPDYHRSGAFPAYYSPYPLSERDFIVSADRGGKFLLYLMDTDGNRELIYEGVNNIFHASPLQARPRPPVIADRVAWPERKDRLTPKGGAIYSSNVYYGAPPELQGKAKFLRILSIDHKTYTYWYKRPYISTGPVVSAVQSDGVKRILGTVPIEPDGSVAFNAPAGVPLHFQLLDAEGRALQTMRSFVGLMPGESRGCLGCHETHSNTPELYQTQTSQALARGLSPITPPPWSDDSVSYVRYVQPVLDKYCGKCHQGDGEGKKKGLDLTFRPGFDIFHEPYLTLIGRPSWGAPYVKPANPPPGFGIADTLLVEGYDTRDPLAYVTPKPMTYLSYKSRLIQIASSGKHHDVKVDSVSLARLIAWVDTMCPYVGEEEIREIPDPVFQGVDWLSVRPRIQTAPKIVRPGPVD